MQCDAAATLLDGTNCVLVKFRAELRDPTHKVGEGHKQRKEKDGGDGNGRQYAPANAHKE
jgi:hypothetical protein